MEHPYIESIHLLVSNDRVHTATYRHEAAYQAKVVDVL